MFNDTNTTFLLRFKIIIRGKLIFHVYRIKYIRHKHQCETFLLKNIGNSYWTLKRTYRYFRQTCSFRHGANIFIFYFRLKRSIAHIGEMFVKDCLWFSRGLYDMSMQLKSIMKRISNRSILDQKFINDECRVKNVFKLILHQCVGSNLFELM